MAIWRGARHLKTQEARATRAKAGRTTLDCVGDCGGKAGAEPVFMGSCWWSSSSVDVTYLDAETFRGIRKISASAQPSGEGTAREPEPLLELDWQADHVVLDANGQRRNVPYAGE